MQQTKGNPDEPLTLCTEIIFGFCMLIIFLLLLITGAIAAKPRWFLAVIVIGVAFALLTGCANDSGSKNNDIEPDAGSYTLTVTQANTCETSIDFTGSTLVAETTGEIWLNYTGVTDHLQFDTCDSGQYVIFEVYHSCFWYENSMGSINGRDQQVVKDCYPGNYGDVLGIRDVDTVIRIKPTGDILNGYTVNFNEVGY